MSAPVRDLSHLPQWDHGMRSLTWWGTLGFVAVEGTAFALAVGAYLYLWSQNDQWPALREPLWHWPATTLTIVLLASVVPNHWANRAAREENLPKVRLWLVVMTLIGLVTLALRAWEIWALPLRWDANAYASMVWLIIGLHATHLITDVADTIVLAVLMFTRHGHGRRFSDVTDNVFYWYFVVLAWVPLYLLLYLGGRP